MIVSNDNQILYPEAPWTLIGKGLQSIFLAKISGIQHLVPKEFKIVNILPGYTLLMISAGHYDSRSSLQYNELIVCPAMVKCEGKIGFWISNIYVDSINSQKGGSDIWKLEKEIAQFLWSDNYNKLEVKQNGLLLLNMWLQKSIKVPLPSMSIRAFSSTEKWLSGFVGKTSMRSRIGIARVNYGTSCPFNYLTSKKGLGLHHYEGQMIASEPDILISKTK